MQASADLGMAHIFYHLQSIEIPEYDYDVVLKADVFTVKDVVLNHKVQDWIR